MRCTPLFLYDELDDRRVRNCNESPGDFRPHRLKLSRANLGVLILAGGEPFTRKDLPEIVSSFYRHNNLESVY